MLDPARNEQGFCSKYKHSTADSYKQTAPADILLKLK